MPNPFMLASAPPTTTTEMVDRCFRQGWGGAVLKTLTYQVSLSSNVTPRIAAYKDGDEILGFTNCELGTPHTIEEWAEDTYKLKKKWPDRGVFVSLLHTEGLFENQWREVARMFTEAGADGFELNFSCSHGMAEAGGGASIGSSDELVEKVASWVVTETSKPVMTKLPAMVNDLPGKAKAAQRAGAAAVSTINTLNSLPGIDIRTFSPLNSVDGLGAFQGLSGRAIKPVALRSVAQVASAVNIPISGIGGIYKWQDAVEFILAGASSLQICSAVMEYGYRIIGDLCAGLLNYMEEMGFSGIGDFVGKALPNIKKHHDLSRSYRVKASADDSCVGCGRCVASCADSGYKAISLDEARKAVFDSESCDGCGLCSHVCPVRGCITLRKEAV
jgi:dihydropyrimidine dehydrogenase (NAD+) subunit PreA